MARNLVLCCDGTANEFAKHRTNVVKLFSVLDHDRQCTYYHPGLGTMEAAGALTTVARRTTKVLGMAFGYGLRDDIRDTYIFLMRNYQPDDRIFMFGFSRGAYTARSVAALLRLYGLIRPGNEPLVPYAIRMMLAINRRNRLRNSNAVIEEYFSLADDFKNEMSCIDCKVHFVGVWDTVASVGWIENPLKLPFIADNPDIAIGRHAVAIDERRHGPPGACFKCGALPPVRLSACIAVNAPSWWPALNVDRESTAADCAAPATPKGNRSS